LARLKRVIQNNKQSHLGGASTGISMHYGGCSCNHADGIQSPSVASIQKTLVSVLDGAPALQGRGRDTPEGLIHASGVAVSSVAACLNTAGVEECFQVFASDAYVAANLDVGNAALGDQATHEPDLGAQLPRHFFDSQ
jgi:hypothetical protein